MPISVTIEGTERLARKFNEAGQVRVLRPSMVRALARLEDPLKTYPGPIAAGVWAANTKPQQKRAFFAALRAGRTSSRRTGTLGRRWVSVIREGGSRTLTGEIGNATIYGPYVQDPDMQARFHRGRWITTQQALEQNRQAIIADFNRAIEQALEE